MKSGKGINEVLLTLAAPGGGHIMPAGSVSRTLRVNQQSYELEIL